METMIRRLFNFICSLLSPQPVRLAIVRRYQDANGNYVGELYMEQTISRKHDTLSGYTMIGASLDSLPLDALNPSDDAGSWRLDTVNDFLAAMTPRTIRVGALDPRDNDEVRRLVAKLPRRKMSLVIQNRFIEYVIDRKPC